MGKKPDITSQSKKNERDMNNQKTPLSFARKREDIYQKATTIGAILIASGAIFAAAGLSVLGIGISEDVAMQELFKIYGPSVASDALLGIGAIMLSVGFAIITPSVTINHNAVDLKGYWVRIALLLVSSAALGLVIRLAREHISTPHAAELGIGGMIGVNAAFIGVIVGIYKSIGMTIDYHSNNRVENGRAGFVVLKCCLAWSVTTALCAVASVATPLLESVMVSAAVGVVDSALLLLLLTLEYNVSMAIERGFARSGAQN
ncbi:MAG: hypothetical protein JSS50_04060 [Proteobacteria bacterium]|nr:hypothetical protein [Pseudomonadota bacterium]